MGTGKESENILFRRKDPETVGTISVTRCGQEILKRSACEINPANGNICMRFEAGFPANGRTINARELSKILFDYLPECVESLLFSMQDKIRKKWNVSWSYP